MTTRLCWAFNGGLGNQIFVYLASLYIEKLNQFKTYYCLSQYLNEGYREFDLCRLLSVDLPLIDRNSQSPRERIKRKSSHITFSTSSKLQLFTSIAYPFAEYYLLEDKFSGLSLNTLKPLSDFLSSNCYQGKNFSIEGYWQNPSSYIKYLPSWRSIFANSERFIPSRWKDVSYIAIHIRRGDFFCSDSHDFIFSRFNPIYYLQSSIALIPDELRGLPIIVVTDDHKWAQYYMPLLLFGYDYIVISSVDPLQDWALLANSRFSIVGNSTFSFSAAILNCKSAGEKYRMTIPHWLNASESSFGKGWGNIPGSLVV